MNRIETYITDTYESQLQTLGYTLVDVTYLKEGANYYLRLFLERNDMERISLDDCEAASRAMSAAFDEDTTFPIQVPYVLEVSSPGIERPLKKPADFTRFLGETVQVHLYAPMEGAKVHKGQLQDADGTGITLAIEKSAMIRIPYEAISKAHLYFEF